MPIPRLLARLGAATAVAAALSVAAGACSSDDTGGVDDPLDDVTTTSLDGLDDPTTPVS